MPDPHDEAMAAIKRAIDLVRALNRADASRPKSAAKTHLDEAYNWLWAEKMAQAVQTNEENARVR